MINSITQALKWEGKKKKKKPHSALKKIPKVHTCYALINLAKTKIY